MLVQLISVVLVVLAGGSATWAAQSATSAAPSLSLQDVVDQARLDAKVPGLVVALRQPGGELVALASGVANLQQNVPVKPDDCFPVGSITKMFTSVIVLQLAEQGKLSLDDPLSKYQPQFPGGQAITLRMLLNHTSGIWDYADMRLPIELVPLVAAQTYSPQEIIDYVGQQPLYFAPGAGFHYSNSNYILLGKIIEQVTGSTYAQQLHQRIIDKLGLTRTYFAGFDQLPASEMHGYALARGQYRDRTAWENPSLAWAAGSLISNAQDLTRFITALFSGQLLKPGSLALMQQGVPVESGGTYGLGLTMFDLPGGRAFGHSGETLSFSTELYYQPDTGMVLVVLANLAFCPTQTVARDILSFVQHTGTEPGSDGLPNRPSREQQGTPSWAIGGN